MKNVIEYSILVTFFILSFYVKVNSQNSNQSNSTITEIWATDRIFETPESVLYDEERNVIYVSNISGSPPEKDGIGFISKLGTDGKIEKLKWIEGLNAPKGMGLFDDKLYVADLDQIVEISISKEKISNRYHSNKAQFLNDISIDNSGNVYVSDNRANIIFQLKDGKLESWLISSDLNSPNGLFAEKDRLLVGIDGTILSVDYQTKRITHFIENTDFIDGQVPDGIGNYIVSDFLGAVHLVHPGKGKLKIIDTTSQEVLAADIDFIDEQRILLVPTFSDNRIVAYQFNNKNDFLIIL